MIVVVASFPGRPERRQDIVAALQKVSAASRGDAGCRSYAFYADVENPDSFASIETWDDRAALDAHFEQPHTKELLAAAGDLVAAAPVITVHEVSATSTV